MYGYSWYCTEYVEGPIADRKVLPNIRHPTNFFILDKAISTEDYIFETLIEIAMSMITASLWVSRGAAAQFPERYDINEEELSRISKLAKLKLEDAKEDLRDAKNGHLGPNETEESEESEVRVQQSHA